MDLEKMVNINPDPLYCDFNYGYYSKKQFNILLKNNNNKINRPYIYYYNENNDIVQITEVSKNSNLKNFDDVIKLGKLTKFHSANIEPLNLTK
jgi:hypothetical protein